MYMVDRFKNVVIVRPRSVVTRHIRFDGRVIAGMFSIFWGNIEADEVYLSKGCRVNGEIICRKAVIGAYNVFNRVYASELVIVQNRCVGNEIRAKNVYITSESVIKSVTADERIVIDGSSRLGKLNARRIIALKRH